MYTDDERKRIYGLLNTAVNPNNKIAIRKRDKAIKKLAYETIEILAAKGCKVKNINEILETAINLTNDEKGIYINKAFKSKVKRKYNNSCVICGRTDNLSVHHLKPIKYYPELKFKLNNTVLLCTECHENLHDNKIKINSLKEA